MAQFSNSFFSSASHLNISGGEFSNVNGNQTKNVHHDTSNITGSYNTNTTTNTNSGNWNYSSKNESRDNRQVYQDRRRVDGSSWNNSGSGGYATREQPWAQGNAPRSYQQPQQPVQTAYPQHRTIEALPKAQPRPLPVQHARHAITDGDGGDGYSGQDKVLNDQIMASLKVKPNVERVPRQVGVGARPGSAPVPEVSQSQSQSQLRRQAQEVKQVSAASTSVLQVPQVNMNSPRPLPPVVQANPFRRLMMTQTQNGLGASSGASTKVESGGREEVQVPVLPQAPAPELLPSLSPSLSPSESPSPTPTPSPSSKPSLSTDPQVPVIPHNQGSVTGSGSGSSSSSSSSSVNQNHPSRDETKIEVLKAAHSQPASEVQSQAQAQAQAQTHSLNLSRVPTRTDLKYHLEPETNPELQVKYQESHKSKHGKGWKFWKKKEKRVKERV
ncbi:hypothetical protein E1B28_011802 [Marasmius oreades]|uniref:Uncharacterized protein n=1 Tax=Marasmius oreades TaxID=181124 RepID=A0A9P7UQC3_9AGAR|nr:uncharacterized protein E1B28_011802 [Marasmius oreades]KAG7090198.1 hypothetical protein E1B28_011802 [Marasmius oreades]